MPVLALVGITDKVAYHSSMSTFFFFGQVPFIKKEEVMSPHRSHIQSSPKWAKNVDFMPFHMILFLDILMFSRHFMSYEKKNIVAHLSKKPKAKTSSITHKVLIVYLL